jgi:hypothetical protein
VVDTPEKRPPATSLPKYVKKKYGVPEPVTKKAAKQIQQDTGVDLVKLVGVAGRKRRAVWAFRAAAALALADGPLPMGDALAIGVLAAYGTYEVVQGVKDVQESFN